jgi:hypothetical protein
MTQSVVAQSLEPGAHDRSARCEMEDLVKYSGQYKGNILNWRSILLKKEFSKLACAKNEWFAKLWEKCIVQRTDS